MVIKLPRSRESTPVAVTPPSTSLALVFVPDRETVTFASSIRIQLYIHAVLLCRHDFSTVSWCLLSGPENWETASSCSQPFHTELGAVNARATAPSTEGGARAPSMPARAPSRSSYTTRSSSQPRRRRATRKLGATRTGDHEGDPGEDHLDEDAPY